MEAGAFYALSLLAAEPPDDRRWPTTKKAVASTAPALPARSRIILDWRTTSFTPATIRKWPRRAAGRPRYAGIASSSAHAVHMPSHIFARLGLWQEDIQANVKSVALTQKSSAMYMGGHELHAMHFLLYAYLQTGQDAKAKQIRRAGAADHCSGTEERRRHRYDGVLRLRSGALPCTLRSGNASLGRCHGATARR